MGVDISANARIETGTGVTSGTNASGKSITFDTPYNFVPNINITPSNMASGDYYTITSKSKTGFIITFKNSSNAVINRTFDWISRGA